MKSTKPDTRKSKAPLVRPHHVGDANLTFGGIITQVITQTNDTDYYVGQVFVGYYQYVSPVVNGTFYSFVTQTPGANQSLRGLIYLTLPDTFNGLTGLTATPNNSYLVVNNGLVTNLNWSWQMGDYYAFFTPTGFQTRQMPSGPEIDTSGTLTFSPPVQQNGP